MINRDNYHMFLEFIEYRREVVQNSEKTLHIYWLGARHLLAWADSRHLSDAPKFRPTFPEFIQKHREDDGKGALAPAYQEKLIINAREFFKWAILNKDVMSKISPAFVESLVVRKSLLISKLKHTEYYTLAEIRKIATLEPVNLRQRRDIAAICFMFLSGIRIGAFVTLPCAAVNLPRRKIIQSPEIGVKTKNSKAATTFLLNIPDILEPVIDWDRRVRPVSGDDGFWYAQILCGSDGYRFGRKQIVMENHTNRQHMFRQGLIDICLRAGVEYKSPHKIRHGFGVYGVKNSKDMKELKAISQNMMHSSVTTTDSIYGNLDDEDLGEAMSNFGR